MELLLEIVTLENEIFLVTRVGKELFRILVEENISRVKTKCSEIVNLCFGSA